MYAAWQAPFRLQKFAPVERYLRSADIRRVLDVGCGPGTNAPRFAGVDYVGVDINDEYLSFARARYRGRFIRGDIGRMDLSALGTFDTILVNSFLHHLPDDAVRRVVWNLRALLGPDGAVHILELVLPERISVARIMARLDRGRHPRSVAAWRGLFEPHFERHIVEPYRLGWGLWSMLYFQGRTR